MWMSKLFCNLTKGFCHRIISKTGATEVAESVKSNRKAMNRKWAIKRQIPLLQPKREINKYYT